MATIVNTPPAAASTDSGNGLGTLLAVIVLLLMMVLFFVYGLPALRSVSSPSISVPDRVDVNVQTPQTQ